MLYLLLTMWNFIEDCYLRAGGGEAVADSAASASASAADSAPPPPASEGVATIVVSSFPELGMLVALRFLDWVIRNPEGVVALPTGKTPEYFIHWTRYFLARWKEVEVRRVLAQYGITQSAPPSFGGVRFVQIDEFYPIDAEQQNSFYYYVRRYYIQGFGLDMRKALLINPNEIGLAAGETIEAAWPQYHVDLSLRERGARNFSEERQQRLLIAVDQFCNDYEERIRAMGGIGFFLGGIGPDGHIGFNVRGSSHYSTTRLCATNYETQAAAAIDLGGIEIARTRLVITIGLSTITRNPDCVAIIMAAGDAKAAIVNDAICGPTGIAIPASALRVLPGARFYITAGAATRLEERNYLRRKRDPARLKRDTARIITELALARDKSIVELDADDFARTDSGRLLLRAHKDDLPATLRALDEAYRGHVTDALVIPSGHTFLHTAPHHDDIMLGYMPYLTRLMRDQTNTHYFAYLTSGFTSVSNKNLLTHVDLGQKFLTIQRDVLGALEREAYFDYTNATFRDHDVLEHLDGVAAQDVIMANLGTARRFLRNLNELYGARSAGEFGDRLEEVARYLRDAYPGMKDTPEIQRLKGMIREWEADLLWGFFGFDSRSVIHARLGFYKGDIFTEQPQQERDILPVVDILRTTRPTVISVALDPEGSGPDTHYKVLQAIAAALKQYQRESGRDDIEIWGYRNVWCRYQPFEATHFISVSLMSMAVLQHTFINSFLSQADASFPSYELDGSFSALAQKVQVEQYRHLLTLLGRPFFYQNSDSRIRSTRGIIFLKKMTLKEFYSYSAAMLAQQERAMAISRATETPANDVPAGE